MLLLCKEFQLFNEANIWFGPGGIYGMLTIVGYLMPNPPNIYIYIYIYIYILSLKKKPKTGYFRIINLFPSCFVFLA